MPYSKAFKKLKKNVEETYLHKKVPRRFWDRYGKSYDEDEILDVAFAIAKSRGIKTDK